jgi:hypothetical protein
MHSSHTTKLILDAAPQQYYAKNTKRGTNLFYINLHYFAERIKVIFYTIRQILIGLNQGG